VLVKAAREINDGSEDLTPLTPSTPTSTNGSDKSFSSSNFSNFISPKNVSQPTINDSLTLRTPPSIGDRMKTGLMKKPSGVVD
jgi:hypothetical protein